MKQIKISFLLILACASFATAEDFGGYIFLRISGEDARAVVKTPKGGKRLVAAGEVLGDARIVEIAADRVVLEQSDKQGATVLIVKIKDGRQQVSRIQQLLVKTQVVSGAREDASKQLGQ